MLSKKKSHVVRGFFMNKLGEIITKNAIRSVRPGYGMLPKYLKAVIGQKVTCDIVKNTPVKNQFLEKPIY